MVEERAIEVMMFCCVVVGIAGLIYPIFLHWIDRRVGSYERRKKNSN